MPTKKKPTKKKLIPEPIDKILIKKAKNGDKKAIESLIKDNFNLIAGLANKYHNCFKSIDANEFMAEGQRGILEAIEHYDLSKKVKFSTYAWFWIVKNIQDYISSSVGLIDIPKNVIASLRKVVSSHEEQLKRGEIASLENISKELDMDLDKVRGLLSDKANLSTPLHLDSYIDGDDKEVTLGDVVADQGLDSIKEMLDRTEEGSKINEWIKDLSEMENEVIKLRYGFDGRGYHSLKDVSKKLKIAPNRVRDIEAQAVYKLKKAALSKSDED